MSAVKALSKQTFKSLHVRNYRVFFTGQLISMIGTWMQSTGQVWLVLQLTHSGTAVGLIVATQFVPMLFLGVFGGVIADRVDKRLALVCTQTSMGLTAGVLGLLVLTGNVRLWMVFACAAVMGLATVVDNPTRQAFVPEMVGKNDLPNAVALNSALFNGARIIGPAIAGLLIGATGTTWPCFLLNSVSYLAVIYGLLKMRTAELHLGQPLTRQRGQISAGLRYVWSAPELRSTMLLLAVVGTFALNFTVVLPLMAKVAFHRGPEVFGTLTSCMGAGSLLGALYTASRLRPSRRFQLLTCVTSGASILVAAAVPTLTLELLSLLVVGASTISFLSTSNSTLQLGTTPEMRGRVMALYAMVLLGSTPIGGPIVGYVSQHFGPRYGLGLGGVATLVAVFAFGASLLRDRRRIRGEIGESIPAEPVAA